MLCINTALPYAAICFVSTLHCHKYASICFVSTLPCHKYATICFLLCTNTAFPYATLYLIHVYTCIDIRIWGNDWQLVRFIVFIHTCNTKMRRLVLFAVSNVVYGDREHLSIGHRNRWDDSQFACFKLFLIFRR